MPFVELVGPPGGGKSALSAACVQAGVQDARRSLRRPRSARLERLADLARTSGLPGPTRAVLDRLLVEPDEAETELALMAVADAWTAYLELLRTSAPTITTNRPSSIPAATSLAVMERSWLLTAVRVRALVEPLIGAPLVHLLDEGLTHPYKAHAAVGDDDAALLRYAAVVPLPDVLVVVETESDTLMRRLRRRIDATPTRARWLALGIDADDARLEDELERTRRAVAIVADGALARGCRVVRIDTTDATPEEAAARLIEKLAAAPRTDPEGHP